MTWRASNPRRVGLHGMGWGLGGRHAAQVDGCRENEVSLRVVERRYVLMAQDGFNALTEPQAGGMQRGRAAGPLAKVVLYYKTHLASAERDLRIQRISARKTMTKFARFPESPRIKNAVYNSIRVPKR